MRRAEQKKFVDKFYDGSNYFQNVDYPTFWMNGTNDAHFSMPAFQQSAQAVKGPVIMRFKLKMPHGHKFDVKEIYAFADSMVKEGKPLLTLSKPTAEGNIASITCETPEDVKKTELLYTTDDSSDWPKKEWTVTEANVSGSKISGALPPGTVAFYFEVTDTRDLMVSSEYLEHTVPVGENQ
jgi:hypothetical protein